MSQPLQRSVLGNLTRIAAGGQGIVYTAPGIRTTVSEKMVFKEYKPPFQAQLDVAALAAMPRFLTALPATAAHRLISIAAWNCGLVEDNGKVVGFVMPRIPDQFAWTMTFPGGPKTKTTELQHLLNHPDMLYNWGHVISLIERLGLIRSFATNLNFMHQIGIVVGDLSPKNLLFSFAGGSAQAYFIDTDAMIVNGRTALPPVETPGWSVPPGEPPATAQADTYKLALIALRLLTADQESKSPQTIPTFTPPLLRQLITDTLTAAPHARPAPATWVQVLDAVARTVTRARPL